MKALYLECGSGISGDMVVAALIDLGASREMLDAVLTSLPVSGFQVKVSRVKKSGLDCCDFDVVLDHDNHDHDMAYLHGGEPGYDAGGEPGDSYGHTHGHAGEQGALANAYGREEAHECEGEDAGEHKHEHAGDIHAHAHNHEDGHCDHDHEHRGLAEIRQIIDASSATTHAKDIAKRIFDVVAQAESKAHGVPVDQVHFHEVGAVDSIVDVLAAAVCFDDLGIDDCIVPCLHEGTGTVRSQHGILPVPVPAVANIVQQQGLSMSIMEGVKGEFVTPTGAAIAAALRTGEELPREFKVLRVGMGAGKRTYSRPSILRAMIIEYQVAGQVEARVQGAVGVAAPQGLGCASPGATDGRRDSGDSGNPGVPGNQRDPGVPGNPGEAVLPRPHLWKLEADVDDCSGEALGYLLDRLYEAGAREAHFIPVYMKKNRPGYQVEVLCDEGDIPEIERIMFQDSTTIGVRRSPLWRTELPRRLSTVETEYGLVGVKTVVLSDGMRRTYPEHDDLARIARERNMPYQDVLRAVNAAIYAS